MRGITDENMFGVFVSRSMESTNSNFLESVCFCFAVDSDLSKDYRAAQFFENLIPVVDPFLGLHFPVSHSVTDQCRF